jgi:hypothetical protein
MILKSLFMNVAAYAGRKLGITRFYVDPSRSVSTPFFRQSFYSAPLLSYGKETKKTSFGGWHISGGIIGTYAME